MIATEHAEVLTAPDDWEDFQDFFNELSYGDGLPLVPPTPEHVAAMLTQTAMRPDTSLGPIPPRMGRADVTTLAVNAVLAGCKPVYFPVVLAAVEAVLQPEFNLYGIQATTNPVTPFLLVNGPASQEIGIASGAGCLGPGSRSNATIGRALRLIMLNVGGAAPGELDRATHGQPAKYSFVAAENERETPWQTFAGERGFDRTEDAVSAFGVQGFHNIIDLTGSSCAEVLMTLASAMSATGTNNVINGGQPLLLLPPEHAHALAADGYSKQDVSNYLFEHAIVDITHLPRAFIELAQSRRQGDLDPTRFPLADDPADVHVVVAGGPGIHSVFLPTFGNTRASTRAFRSAATEPRMPSGKD